MARASLMTALVLAGSVLATMPASAAVRTFYVDCAGNDTNSGTSTTSAWRTLTKANAATLAPGDSLLLKRGCVWTGPLNAAWAGTASAPITIGAYGTGNQPRVQNAHEDVYITGSYQIIDNLYVRADPTGYDAGCQNAPTGWRAGFRFGPTAANNTVRNSTAYGLYVGIMVNTGATRNHVVSNTLINNNMKNPDTTSDAGGVGISVMGDYTDVAYNTISGSVMCSELYGQDGSAIEIYGGQYNNIHHNKATDNLTFTELGNSRSLNNTYAYNEVVSNLTNATFVVTRGPLNTKNGPVYGTKVYNNSVYLSGSSSYAVQCGDGCSASVLSFHNNIVWAEDRIGYADAAFDEGNNIYWRADGQPKIWFPISSSSRKVDPKWTSVSNRNLALTSGSPAIDKSTLQAVNLGFTTDLTGAPVPQGVAPDIGDREFPQTAPTSSGTVYVNDGFQRTLTGKWGSAGTGGAYSSIGTATDYNVNGTAGTMALAPSASRASYLPSVSARDVNSTFRVRVDKAPTGGGDWIYFVARASTATNTEYRLLLHLTSTGAVTVGGTKVLSGVETSVGTAETSTGVTYAAGTDLMVRAQAVGTAPATLRVRVWRAGQAEPTTWNYTATDATGLAAGSTALRAFVAGTSTATSTITFDDWSVTAP